MPALLQDAFRGVSPAVLSTWPGGVGVVGGRIPLRGGAVNASESWENNMNNKNNKNYVTKGSNLWGQGNQQNVTMKTAELATKTYVPPAVGGTRKHRRRPTRKAHRKASRKVHRKSRRLTRRR